MARFGFVGPSYTSQSVNADCQLTMNLYPEVDESGIGKSSQMLYSTPGLKPFFLPDNSDDVAVRGIYYFGGFFYQVNNRTSHNVMYQIDPATGSFTALGGLMDDNGTPASFAANPTQLLICSGGSIYLFGIGDHSFSLVASAPTGISQIGFSDSYFVALQSNSRTFFISSISDGLTWNLLDFGTVSEFPDNIVSMLVDHREIWFWGSKQSTVYEDTGDPNFPFNPVPGGFIEQGAAALFGAARLDNTVFWMEADERGQGMAFRASGYTPVRVSNHAIEHAWSQYSKISDLITFSYQDQGHTFWVLYFPTANATWVCDSATNQQWHQRDFWYNGKSNAWTASCHAFGAGKHIVGDTASGYSFAMSINYLTNDRTGVFNSPSYKDGIYNIHRVRRAPHVGTEEQWTYHSKLQVYFESGLGPIPPLTGGTPQGISSVLLMDTAGQRWQVTIRDDGLLQTMLVHSGDPNPIIFADNMGHFWEMTVELDGRISTRGTPLGYNSIPIQPFITQGRLQSALYVNSSGQYITNQPVAVIRGPRANLRWSNDGGHTWSNYLSVDCGQAGLFKTRAIWRRLSRARDRVFELSMDDPISWRIIDAFLNANPGYQPTEKLASQYAKIT